MNRKREEENLPKLSLEEENAFKKMKLFIEYDMHFPDLKKSKGLPPDIEGQFLDYILEMEQIMRNPTKISVYQKIGSPEFIPASFLRKDEIADELERILEILEENQIFLSVLCEYNDFEERIYTFITTELFEEEIDDINVAGINTNFIYEDFYPNTNYDIEMECKSYLVSFFNKESEFYDLYIDKKVDNYLVLNSFRQLFSSFEYESPKEFQIELKDKIAQVCFEIDFIGYLEPTCERLRFAGKAIIDLDWKYDTWCIKKVCLPIY